MNYKSIICPSADAFQVGSVNIQRLKELYFNVNIDRFIENLDEIKILECSETSLKFFYPSSKVAGDGKFYEELSNGPSNSYYPQWRWAHTLALKEIKTEDKILEIGSGGMTFLKKLTQLNYNIIGLEINQESIRRAKQEGLALLDETIETHSNLNIESYDVVCCFEVLEHISDVNLFIKSALKTLKKGGRFIFSVPNNSSYLKDIEHYLNMPPHHVVLWDEISIRKIQNVFSVKMLKQECEELEIESINWFLSSKDRNVVNTKIIGAIYIRSGLRKLALKIIELFRTKFKGQTIFTVFEKI